eukprot:TRINITY_DN15355_c0_g2_i3.p2 TRINITY_DN15355_c0_g2~~TRINITY_DN15355_c0_g2_i3.p2  ORF type:complete len:128 (-),score=4.75 TRINITY_DN15355_c0_g2_i3:143-493(-)
MNAIIFFPKDLSEKLLKQIQKLWTPFVDKTKFLGKFYSQFQHTFFNKAITQRARSCLNQLCIYVFLKILALICLGIDVHIILYSRNFLFVCGFEDMQLVFCFQNVHLGVQQLLDVG